MYQFQILDTLLLIREDDGAFILSTRDWNKRLQQWELEATLADADRVHDTLRDLIAQRPAQQMHRSDRGVEGFYQDSEGLWLWMLRWPRNAAILRQGQWEGRLTRLDQMHPLGWRFWCPEGTEACRFSDGQRNFTVYVPEDLR